MAGDDDVCSLCGQWNDGNKHPAATVNWIHCSSCDKPFHCFCARINAVEFKILSAPGNTWFCSACRNGGVPADMDVLLKEIQAKIDLAQPNHQNIEKAITSAVSSLGTTIESKLNACMSSLDGRFDLLKDKIESQIADRVDAVVAKNLESLNASDDTRQRVLETDIDRSVTVKLANAIDPKLATLRTEILAEVKAMIPLNTDLAAINNCVANVSKVEAFNDRAERQLRRPNLVLRNLPDSFDNNTADLRALIVQIGTKCGFELKSTDVVRAVRFKSTKHKICPIIIKFAASDIRDRFFAYYFKNLSRFNLSALGFGDSPSRVYFNEHLTDRNMQIFNMASQMKGESGFARVSTFNGVVFVTRTGQSKGIPIHDTSGLKNFAETDSSSK